MKWVLKVVLEDGKFQVERFDPDEIGTLDDMWSVFMMTDLQGIQSITVTREEA